MENQYIQIELQQVLLEGYGASHGTFAVESAVNKLAAKLNMDPTEIRLKNLIKKGKHH